jgi:hypothetical protein
MSKTLMTIAANALARTTSKAQRARRAMPLSSFRRRVGLVAGVSLTLVVSLLAGAEGAAKPRQIVIGLDLSMSFPLVDSEQFAKRAAERVAPAIRDFPPRSLVTLRTFGVYDPTANPLRFDKQISSVNRAPDVASAVQTIIMSVPSMVASGKLAAQPKTNIVAFLETMAQTVDCKRNKTAIVLVSDGIEDSEYARLTTEKAHLPAPARKFFDGCEDLQFLGLGVGTNRPALTEHLRQEWAAWAKDAGFKNFSGLYDW